MAKTKIHNSHHPKLLQTLLLSIIILAVACVIYFIVSGCMKKYDSFHYVGPIIFLSVIGMNYSRLINWIEIDDEKKTLTLSTDKKNPVDITKIDRLTLHHAKSGKVKYIMVHEVGKRYAEFLTRPDSVNEIVELMQQVNPQIEIVKYKL